MNLITTQPATGTAITGHIEELATLRLDIFAEYPYLYRGRRADELAYLADFANKPGASTILARDGDAVIGAATGAPLAHEQVALRDPFATSSHSPDDAYYIGELLFRQEYRGRGLGKRLLTLMENHVLSLGGFQMLTCATVERPLEHPCRPQEYTPIDRFLGRTGFVRLDGIVTHFTWTEVDGAKRDHVMQFWIKELPGVTA